MIEILPLWKLELQKIKPSANSSFAKDIAQWYYLSTIGTQANPTIILAPGFLFTFQTAILETKLLTLGPSLNVVAQAIQLAEAWEAAILASTVVVAPGASLLPTTPATLFSVVSATVIDPDSIQIAKAKIVEILSSSTPATSALDSKMADAFYEAATKLTITITGINSVPPPAGPLPLVAPKIPLI